MYGDRDGDRKENMWGVGKGQTWPKRGDAANTTKHTIGTPTIN